jgi:hypothetical protein
VTYENWDSAGAIHLPYGDHPLGYLFYMPSGHMSAQIMRTPPQKPFGGDSVTAAEALTVFEGYVAYFGRYTVDSVRGLLIHHVEGSLDPDYTGTDQTRPFKVHGDTLIIEGGSPSFRFRRVFIRVADLQSK